MNDMILNGFNFHLLALYCTTVAPPILPLVLIF